MLRRFHNWLRWFRRSRSRGVRVDRSWERSEWSQERLERELLSNPSRLLVKLASMPVSRQEVYDRFVKFLVEEVGMTRELSQKHVEELMRDFFDPHRKK